VRLLLANGEQLPCPDARFDLVTCVRALHHMSNPESCLREIARVMRPGGRLAILDNLTYEDPALASRHNALETRRDSSHSRTFSASGLKGALEQAGLAVRAWVAEEWLRRITAWWDDAGTESEERDRLLESIEAGTRAQDPFFLRHFQRLAGGWHFRYQQAWVLACRT
jgi:ubiquinone/menaquinone biosynthesis C-methylase UbiE